jgi:hypothetical protein
MGRGDFERRVPSSLDPQGGRRNTTSGDPYTLPRWSYPFILVLLGIVLYIGALSSVLRIGVGVETVLFLVYLLLRSRRTRHQPPIPARVLPLFPGHLLLLLALSLLPAPPAVLAVLWMVVPLSSVTYDFVASWSRLGSRFTVSILSILYCIIWADLFILMERIVVLGRGLRGTWEIVTGVGFALLGVLWLFLGVFRHWKARGA